MMSDPMWPQRTVTAHRRARLKASAGLGLFVPPIPRDHRSPSDMVTDATDEQIDEWWRALWGEVRG